jgi:hypothetical protein
MLNIKKSLKKANLIFAFLVVHACASSALTAPALTGITLSRTTWNGASDAANTAVTVTPEPAGAVLPACTTSPANLLTVGAAYPIAAQFIINPAAVTANTTVTITCGDKTASLALRAAVIPAQIKDLFYRTDLNGNLIIYFQLARSLSEIAGKTKTSFWVAARVPSNGFFLPEDQWFFLTSNGWSHLSSSQDVELLAYKNNQVPEIETYFTIPAGLPETDFRYLNVDFYFGYMDAEGSFKNMGVIWDGTQ